MRTDKRKPNAAIRSRYASRRGGIEWPTVLLCLAVYAAFGAITFGADLIGIWFAIPLLAVVIALHSSLQHEVLHGHPFRSVVASQMTIVIAIGLLIPFGRFKALHLQHHQDSNLTDPYDDPESNYLDVEYWARLGKARRVVYHFNATLLGRMLIGPALSLWAFYREEIRGLANLQSANWWAWGWHGLGLIPVALWWIHGATLPIWAYLLSAYGGLSLLKIRTYLEHQAEARVAARTVIIEDGGPLALLFLNNNLHAVHHAYPGVAWYRLPELYKSRRDEFLTRNRGYRYVSYGEIFRCYLFKPKDPVVYPLRKERPE